MATSLLVLKPSMLLRQARLNLLPAASLHRSIAGRKEIPCSTQKSREQLKPSFKPADKRISRLFATDMPPGMPPGMPSDTPGQQVLEMSVEELKLLMSVESEAEDSQFLDVREASEHSICSLPNFRLLPMSRLAEWGERIVDELDAGKRTVVLCHHGVRSYSVAEFLISQGFVDVYSIEGGIDMYAREIDNSLERY